MSESPNCARYATTARHLSGGLSLDRRLSDRANVRSAVKTRQCATYCRSCDSLPSDLLEIAENSVNSSSHLRSLVRPRTTTLRYLRHAGYRGAMFCAATSWLFPRLNLQRTKLEKGRTTRGRCLQRFQLYRQNPLQPRQSRSLKIHSPNTASEKPPPFEPGHPSRATSIPAISPPVSTRDANQESVLARSWNRHRAITSIFKGRRRTGKGTFDGGG